MIKKDWIDASGVRRRSWLQFEADSPEQGMPADVFDDLDILYQGTSETFRIILYGRLWDLNLIEPQDYDTNIAIRHYRQALQFAIRHDATDAIRHIRQLDLETI